MTKPNAIRSLFALLAVCLPLLAAGCKKKKAKDPTCDSKEDCPAHLLCIDNVCQKCEENTDCPEGNVCEAGACVPGDCTQDSECQGGVCRDKKCVTGTACKVDEDCADDEDCIDGICQSGLIKATGGDLPTCVLGTVYFGYDEATLSPTARDIANENATCLGKAPERKVMLAGHTDPSGTDEYNIALSERRAQAVADFLTRLGLDPERFIIVPKGETETTGIDEKDRRVEFQWR